MRYLHRHPSELDLSIDEMAEVAFVGREIERREIELAGGGS